MDTHKFLFDGASSQLEPTYFWILDFMQERFGLKVRKLVDNFSSSPGSGHFGEMGIRATKMQEEAMKVMGTINQVVKSALNLVYDLKEFEIRLDSYKKAKSEDIKEKEAGLLSLKQVWLDQVDMKRQRGSIHQMTYELGYTTLRDAFMIANSKEEVEKMASQDGLINEQVKRILIPRVEEFKVWVEMSEKELEKRFAVEKSYLKTQVETLKLYASWAKPYLKAAEELKMRGFAGDPSLVNAFNTAMFELVIMGTSDVKVEDPSAAKSEGMNPRFLDYITAKKTRTYTKVMLIGFTFRGLPQRITQRGDYGFGGKIEVSFDCYVLNDDELNVFNKQVEKDAIDFSFSLLKDAVDAPLEQLKEDLNHFLEDKKKKDIKEEKKQDETNPFTALFSLIPFWKKSEDKKEEKKKPEDLKEVKSDNYIEQYLRKIGAESVIKQLYTIYDVYKKAHGQASSPADFDSKVTPPKTKSGNLFKAFGDSFTFHG